MALKDHYGPWALLVGGSEGIGEHLARKLGAAGINAGSYFIAGYSAAKAFNQVLAEALWTELQPKGVHVLAFPIGAADTPSRRRSGTKGDPAMQVAKPEDVAQQALDQLPNGPVYVSAENAEYFRSLYTMSRRQAAELQRDTLLRMIPN